MVAQRTPLCGRKPEAEAAQRFVVYLAFFAGTAGRPPGFVKSLRVKKTGRRPV
jgi:hypothetical protein